MTTVKERTTIEELKRKGIPLISGNKYIPAHLLSKKVISLKEMRRRLAKIKGSLTQTISDIRDEE